MIQNVLKPGQMSTYYIKIYVYADNIHIQYMFKWCVEGTRKIFVENPWITSLWDFIKQNMVHPVD